MNKSISGLTIWRCLSVGCWGVGRLSVDGHNWCSGNICGLGVGDCLGCRGWVLYDNCGVIISVAVVVECVDSSLLSSAVLHFIASAVPNNHNNYDDSNDSAYDPTCDASAIGVAAAVIIIIVIAVGRVSGARIPNVTAVMITVIAVTVRVTVGH